MENKHMVRFSTSYLREFQSKIRSCYIHLSEWPKSKTLKMPNADKDVEQQELSFIASGNSKCTATFEDILAVYYKTKRTLTI